MPNKQLQVKALFEKMLKDGEEYARTYKHYAKDMKGFKAKVQWRFGPVKGYQVFDEARYSYEMNGELEKPDIILACDDLIFARRFLANELDDMRDLTKGDFEITSSKAPDTPSPDLFRQMGMVLGKIPAFRPLMEKSQDPKHSTGVAIPINQSLGTYKNEILPIAVLEHFINKASHVYVMEQCGCRVKNDCKHFDHFKYSTMLLGRGVLRLHTPPEWKGHMGTKQEALERA